MEGYERYQAVLSECLLFRNFSTEEMMECIADADPVLTCMNKNETLTMPQHLKHIYVIVSGQFNVIQDSGMNISLVHVLTPGRCFGIAFCAEDISCNHLLQAAEKGALLRLSYKRLISQEKVSRRLLENLLAITSENLTSLAEKINHTQSRSVRVKLSVFLRDQVKHKASESFVLDMSRKDLADYLNITYPAMLRELSSMQKEGVLRIKGKQITVLDLDRLVEEGSEYNIL